MSLKRGSVVWAALDPTVGHEQRGSRPAIVVSSEAVSNSQRFPLIAIVPLTGTLGKGALYPTIAVGKSGLSKESCALVDQVRSVDKRRLTRLSGSIDPRELQAVDLALRLYLGLA